MPICEVMIVALVDLGGLHECFVNRCYSLTFLGVLSVFLHKLVSTSALH